jgi:anti-sigma regulatory factor (Ser/Thr protein kinase)/GNAT superfamily N-acetyltransferase
MEKNSSISKLILPVDISFLPAILSYAEEIATKLKFADKDINMIKLALEEAATNVIEHAFLPEEQENFEIHFVESTIKLQINVKDKGVPFSPEKVQEFDAKKELQGEAQKGLGFLLMKKSVDDIAFVNRGFAGKEVQITKFLHQKHIEDYCTKTELEAYETDKTVQKERPPKINFTIELLKSEQAIEISQCAYRTYGYSYIWEHIYYPERIVDMNKNGQLISAVAITEDTKEVMSHTALELLDDTDIPELGMAFTKPKFRGQGCFKYLIEFLMKTAKEKGISGVYALGVTTHPFSQKGILKNNFFESAILIGLSPAKIFKGMENQGVQRESVVMLYQNLIPDNNIEIFINDKHKKMVSEIYDNIKLPVSIKTPVIDNSSYIAEAEVKTSVNLVKLTAKITIEKMGENLIDLLKKSLKDLCFKKIETINLYIDLCDSLLASKIDEIEELGFFFAGIFPSEKKQYLILQYLNNVPIDYSKICTVTDFGAKLLDYVKSNDKN